MRPIRWLRRGMLLAGLGIAGGALVVTARHLLETPQPLQSALPGRGRIDRKHGGDIYFNVAGDESNDPIVLLHDFYPGASNYEYRHIFPRLAPAWHVYAPDWLGFGMSEHPSLAFTGEFYANMLIGFLRDVVARPAIVLAHGRAANIAARAASDAPELFDQLVLISPDIASGLDLDPKPTQVVARAAQRVSLGLLPYAVLSTKPLLRRMAQGRSAHTGEQSAGEEAVEHLYASAHQFGGQHALMALMTGELDLPIQNVFPLLQPPVLLLSGDEDPARPASLMEDLAVLNPHADLDVLMGAGETVFEDQPAMFTEALLDWLAAIHERQYPQVEEISSAVQEAQAGQADMVAIEVDEVIVPTEPVAPGESSEAVEPAPEDVAGVEDVAEPPLSPPPHDDMPASDDTQGTSETSENVPGATANPVRRSPGRSPGGSGSAPATRATRRSVSTSGTGTGSSTGGERPKRAASTPRKSGARGSRAQNAEQADKADSSARREGGRSGQGGPGKRPKQSDSPSV
jgi:pimeloyl-ACP methyl ester carboxylesterase